MRHFLIILLFGITLFADTIDCTKVFEERKVELLAEIEKIDEARQSFEALQAATNSLFDKQKAKLRKEKSDIDATMSAVTAKEKKIEQMLEENKKLLEAIDGAKNDKISDTYAKMKDSAAAGIIEELSVDEGAAVLFTLQAKKVSKIMSKMTPKRASEITTRLRVGPPFQ